MKLTIKPVSREDYRFLYNLLSERDSKDCISHKVMPTYEQHCVFNESIPYKEDFIIILGNKPIGRVYITRLDEVGIHLLRKYNGDMYEAVLKEFLDKIRYANVSPKNKKLKKILKRMGFRLIQYTYEKNIR